MATRRYMCNPEDSMHAVTEAVGAANVTKNIELNVDWDALFALTPSMSGQQARMQVMLACEKICDYIETTGKYNVKA